VADILAARGDGSPPLLHHFVHGRKIVIVDNDARWLQRFKRQYEGATHRFLLTVDGNIKPGDLAVPFDIEDVFDVRGRRTCA
jgi:hypothetical protein